MGKPQRGASFIGLPVLIVALMAVIAAFFLARPCDDEAGLSAEEAAAIECGALVGDWKVYVSMSGAFRDGAGNLGPGVNARFSLDDDGRVFTEEVVNVGKGRSYCWQSGATFTLNAGQSPALEFELTAPGELRQTSPRGNMRLMFRRKASSCR